MGWEGNGRHVTNARRKDKTLYTQREATPLDEKTSVNVLLLLLSPLLLPLDLCLRLCACVRACVPAVGGCDLCLAHHMHVCLCIGAHDARGVLGMAPARGRRRQAQCRTRRQDRRQKEGPWHANARRARASERARRGTIKTIRGKSATSPARAGRGAGRGMISGKEGRLAGLESCCATGTGSVGGALA